jgi:hypothetical protein
VTALLEKMGVATFFPHPYLFPAGLDKAEASMFLSVRPAAGGLYGQKHNLQNTKQKRVLMPFW